MTPCSHAHCPSARSYCERYSCTRELRNRLERRNNEREQLRARNKSGTLNLMKSSTKLVEKCDKIDADAVQRARKDFEAHRPKQITPPECGCVECAIKHKDRQISALREHNKVLQRVQGTIEDMQRKCRSRDTKAVVPSPSVSSSSTSTSNGGVSRIAASANRGFGMTSLMHGLFSREVLDRGVVYERREERVVFPERRRR